jgi:hypothetical protein
MRKLLISAAILSAIAGAAPAAAQWRDYNRGQGYSQHQGRGLEQQLIQIRQRIDVMYQRRLISVNEARALSQRAENLQRRLYDAQRNGISPREHAELRERIFELRARLQRERFEGREQRWDDRRDRWNDRDDRWDDRRDRRW